MKPLAPIGLLLTLLPAPLPARTVDTVCTELRRIVEATGDRPPFASIVSSPVALPGFGDRCILTGNAHAGRVTCTGTAEGPNHWLSLAGHTARCLPGALRRPDEPDQRLAHFRTGTAYIAIRQVPGPGAGGLSYIVQSIPVH